MTIDPRVAELLAEVGVADVPDDLAISVTGADPVLPTPYPAGEVAAVAMAAAAGVAALVWHDATGEAQDVDVQVPHAAETLLSFLLQRIEGGDMGAMRAVSPVTGIYATGGGRHIHLHGGFEHLALGTIGVLGCSHDRPSIEAATATWDAFALEDALAAAGQCGAVIRTADEWAAHPQGLALTGLPRVTVRKIADGPPRRAADDGRPFGAVRALDLTRVLAGPTVARTLAQHGADVLLVNSPGLDNVVPFVIDTSHGKRSAHLDLDEVGDEAALRALVRQADVFVQGYRGGSLERRGLGAATLAAGHDGLVHVSVSCYGDVGPWRERPGWEQLAQSVSGLARGTAPIGDPALIAAAVCDYTTGYLAALGAAVALRRRATEGGSYEVTASLCQTAMWLQRLGPTLDPARATGLPSTEDRAARLSTTETAWGTLHHLPPLPTLSATPARWDLPPAPPGTHPPAFRPR